MPQYWKSVAFVLLLAACSDKHPPETSRPTAAPAATTAAVEAPVPAAAAPATGRDSVARQPLTLAQLPASLRPTGQLLEAWRWVDANGENVLIASRTVSEYTGPPSYEPNPRAGQPRANGTTEPDSLPAGQDESRTARLLVRQYVRHGSRYQPLWQLQDAVADCPLDLTLGLLPGSTRVSDLDGDGRTETTLLYALACRGGVDAGGLKLVMHAGATKYALRGLAIEMQGGPDEVAYARHKAAGPTCCLDTLPAHPTDYRLEEGLYANEKDFRTAPPAFRTFARQLWRHYRTRADDGTEVR